MLAFHIKLKSVRHKFWDETMNTSGRDEQGADLEAQDRITSLMTVLMLGHPDVSRKKELMKQLHILRAPTTVVKGTKTPLVFPGPIIRTQSPWAFASNFNDGTVSVIDTVSDSFVCSSIIVGNTPHKVAVTPDHSHAWVIKLNSNSISVIDCLTKQVITDIQITGHACDIVLMPALEKAYVASEDGGSLSVISMVTYQVISVIPLNNYPGRILADPVKNHLYVWSASAAGSNTWVMIVDASKDMVVRKIEGSNKRDIGNLAITPDGKKMFMTDRWTDELCVVDLRLQSPKIVKKIPVEHDPWNIVLSPNGKFIWISHSSQYIWIFNAINLQVVQKIDLGTRTNPSMIVFLSDYSKAYVTDYATDTIHVIRTSTFTDAPVSLLNHLSMAVTPDAKKVFITGVLDPITGNGYVAVLDTGSDAIIKTMTVGRRPYGITIG
jgi:YVTN family beta-propeller protein